jgi:hypothetical protein
VTQRKIYISEDTTDGGYLDLVAVNHDSISRTDKTNVFFNQDSHSTKIFVVCLTSIQKKIGILLNITFFIFLGNRKEAAVLFVFRNLADTMDTPFLSSF